MIFALFQKGKYLFIAYAIHVFEKHIRGLAEQKD